MKNRVLHAMGLCKCVVGTSYAMESLGCEDGRDCFCRDDVAGFFEACMLCCRDIEKRNEIARAGYRRVAATFTEARVHEEWLKLFQEAAG